MSQRNKIDVADKPIEPPRTKWNAVVELDKETGEYFITLPQAVIDYLGVGDNSLITWFDNKDGTFSIKKYKEKEG